MKIFFYLIIFLIHLIELYSNELAGTLTLPENALAEYEAKINHRNLINRTDRGILALGARVFQETCLSCHGDEVVKGSVPNALKFYEGKFQHGSDPYKMYQTITRGWRFMPPQMQLKPMEKYAVIHYIRKTFLKTKNPSQFYEVTESYLDSLPKGSELGPKPTRKEPWKEMNYGDFLMTTIEMVDSSDDKSLQRSDVVQPDANIAYKGIAIRLDEGSGGISKGKKWMVFEHDSLRVAGVWEGEGFIDWKGINFNGQHVVRPRSVGKLLLETKDVPAWANPATGKFEDLRFEGRDGGRFGPLPRSWARYQGLHKKDGEIVLEYRVGEVKVFERFEMKGSETFIRHLQIEPSKVTNKVRLINSGTHVTMKGASVELKEELGFVTATIPASSKPTRLAFLIHIKESKEFSPKLDNLSNYTDGGKKEWENKLETPFVIGDQDGGFQWDQMTLPMTNPWKSRMRTSGFDFSNDGDNMYVCCWDGDVWKVSGLKSGFTLKWQRIASGLFQPLGLKMIDEHLYVSCRDQIVELVDRNGDGEIDFYKSFNSDHQVTEHFHEFAMGLQADDSGNLFYAKSACHAREPRVPHHGTLLKVKADGTSTSIVANGFRAANGVCLNKDGSFFVTDQEGHWTPQNRINLVKEGGFYGNMWSYGAPKDTSDSAMELPMAWTYKGFERSPAELIWIDSPKWGALNGKLLNLSYGHGRIEIVPHEEVKGVWQGGLCRLPIPDLPTGIMRGRFHVDGHLYVAGMSAWASSQSFPGGLYRIRKTESSVGLPIKMKAYDDGIILTFSDPIVRSSLSELKESFQVESWMYQRSKNYGSKKYDILKHNMISAELSNDQLEVYLEFEDMKAVDQMSIKYNLKGQDGTLYVGEIQNTIHKLNPKITKRF